MNDKTRKFIEQNLHADIRQLALQGCRDKEVDMPLALSQIAGRQTARRKLPLWAALDGLLYPPHLNMEQCSSEQTARYKATIAKRLLSSYATPTSLVDLTGGFGVDFAFMREAFDEATYVERDAQLFAISSENFKILVKNVKTVNGDGIDFLHALSHATMIFMDPARRDNHGGRTYGIGDCTPNVLEIKDELLQKADVVMLKLSPMLDWRKAVSDLGEQYVSEVHIVSVQNECKELLIVMQQQPAEPFPVYCVNDDAVFIYHPSSASSNDIAHLSSFTFLYEPHASIMKAGCFDAVSSAFSLRQLAHNSHLFVSDQFVADFPGRSFHVLSISSMNKQELKKLSQTVSQANITVRNFPMTVAELRKKLKMGDGGETYIFATTLADEQRVLVVCEKAR
jgi:precorrin-6B methylase 2